MSKIKLTHELFYLLARLLPSVDTTVNYVFMQYSIYAYKNVIYLCENQILSNMDQSLCQMKEHTFS